MKRELIRRVLFFMVMAALLAVPLYMIYSYQITLKIGSLYRFKPMPVDPYDAFRGKYITLSFDNNSVRYDTAKVIFNDGDEVFLRLAKDSAGFAIFSEASKEAPHDADYIKSTVNWYSVDSSGGFLSVSLPFDRYYLPEEMAADAERAYWDNIRWNRFQSDSSAYIDVRVRNGKAVIEELYFQGTPVKDYVRKLQQEKTVE